MSQLILPRRFTSQPQGFADVNWEQNAVEFVFLPGCGLITKSGVVAPTTGNLVSSGTEYGLAQDTTTLVFPISAIVNNTDYTLLGITKGVVGSYKRLFGFYTGVSPIDLSIDATSGTYIEHAGIYFSIETSLASRPEKIAFVHEASGPCRIVSDTQVSADGNTSTTASFNQLRILSGVGKCSVVIGFRKALSIDACREYFAFPNKIFRAKPRVLYFDVGGATDTPSAASSGSFSITGSAANGIEAKLSAASSNSYTLTGSNAAGLIARASTAGSSSYTITGVAASGVKESAGDTPSAASSGSFTISGVTASGVRALKAAADLSSYTLTGSNASGLVSIGADASSGSYTITGVAAEGRWIHVSDASSNAFVITGIDATGVKSGAISLTQADLDAIAAAFWADATAVAAHAKLDAILARLTC